MTQRPSWRPPGRAAHVALGTLSAGVVLGGCGTAQPAKPASVSLAQIEAQNSDARARVAARTRALERRLAGRRAAAPTTNASPARAAPPTKTTVPKPPIRRRFIPFSATRKRETAAYARRHYGIDTYRLRRPHVIVEHYTASATAGSAVSTFTPDVPDSELHELPGICSNFVIDRDGTILQLVPLGLICRHTVGLNYTAIGIEHAGFSDRQVLSNSRELAASLALTRWLRCRFRIPVRDVIGHNESLSSPFHRERVARLRTQTHDDWKKADMDVYRARLRSRPC